MEPIDLDALRVREVQRMGAAISTRSWHDMERAYNDLRDKIDAELIRKSRLSTPSPDLKADNAALWSATMELARKATALSSALDGQEQYRAERLGVLDAMNALAALQATEPRP